MILLIGGSGHVGQAFVRKFEMAAVKFQVIARRQCDYTRRDELIALIDATKPEFLINVAGFTGQPNVDACEHHKAECLFANAVLPAVISEACQMRGLPWGHVSSGCIYSGRRSDGHGFRETDVPNFSFRSPPCSFYSGTKALGEECLETDENVFLWRLRIPFSCRDGNRNYLSKLMRFDRLLDVTNSLADLDEFVDACLFCWLNRVSFGTYNVVNTGEICTQEVVALIQKYHRTDRAFQFFADEAEFMATTGGAPRSHCVLSNRKLTDAGFVMSEVHDAIARSLKNWEDLSG